MFGYIKRLYSGFTRQAFVDRILPKIGAKSRCSERRAITDRGQASRTPVIGSFGADFMELEPGGRPKPHARPVGVGN